MKKTFIFGLIAAALGFTACSSEDDLMVNNQNTHKGMVLRATVEQPAETRATFTDNEGTWQFAFTTGDNVSVSNIDMFPDFYTFTNEGTEFKCEGAKAAEYEITWYAYFPSNEVSLVGQSGTKADVANKYALAGNSSATTGEEGLNITMSPKVAILVINNQKGTIDINVKNSATTWVKGLTANDNGFNVTTSTTQQNLLSVTTKGTYYIAVPAGVQLAVKDGDKVIKSTGTNGLQAGKYYNLTIFPFGQGEAAAKGIGNVRWIQLWENGPKFAEKNVEGKMKLADAKLSGDEYVWGANWCTPTQADLDELKKAANNKSELVTCEYTEEDGIYGFKFTGKTEGYTSNSVFFPSDGGTYNEGDVYYWALSSKYLRLSYYIATSSTTGSGRSTDEYFIRPVLVEE